MNDEKWMRRALVLADMAAQEGEVPVGAVLVKDKEIVGEGRNGPISNSDATAHAEIQAIRAACQLLNNYRLPNTTLYVTLEPCAMCAGALIHARVSRVVIAAKEPRAGAGGSALNVLQHASLNHQCDIEFGLFQAESSALLRQFFRARRQCKK